MGPSRFSGGRGRLAGAPQGWDAKTRATPRASGEKEFIALPEPPKRPSPSGAKPPRRPRKPSRAFPRSASAAVRDGHQASIEGIHPAVAEIAVAWVPEPVPIVAAAGPRPWRKGRRAAGAAKRDRRARLGGRAPSGRRSPAAQTRLGLRDLALCREAHGGDTPAGDEPGTAQRQPIPDRLSGRNDARPVSAGIRPTRVAAGTRASARRRRAARRCGRRRHDGR